MAILPIDKKQFKNVCRLIRNTCCNCKGDYCIALDDECVQLLSPHHIYCKYFLRAVLPLKENLLIDITKDDRAKRCEICEKLFIPKSNRQRFCTQCSRLNRKSYMQTYMREKRSNVKL